MWGGTKNHRPIIVILIFRKKFFQIREILRSYEINSIFTLFILKILKFIFKLLSEFQGKSEIAKKIIEKHSINYDYCEGKGEWENDYIKVVDSSDEILFEDGKW